MSSVDAADRVLYQRFLEFESTMKRYAALGVRSYNAAPIGFCAFALTLFVYSMIVAGATVPMNTRPSMAMGLALFYGGLIQFLAGLFELRIGNNYNAILFCSYAGHWFSLGALYATTFNFGLGLEASIQQKSLGIFYLGWTIFTLAMLISSIRTNVATIGFLSFLLITYILLTASAFQLWDFDLARAGGAFGIFTSAILWYLGFSSLLKKEDNSYFNMPVLNLSPNN